MTLVGDGATWDPTGGKIGGALQLDGTGSAAEDANGASYINGLNALASPSGSNPHRLIPIGVFSWD